MKKIAVITGASSGIGKEFAAQLKNYFSVDELWLIARRADKLSETSELSGMPCKILALDLCKTDSFNALKSELEGELKSEQEKGGATVTALIANAGLGYYGEFDKMNAEKISAMCDLNVRALTLTVNTCLPFMAEGSRILMVSSIASFVPNAFMSVYSSTKAYVTSFARALRFELKSRKIKVTAVCPGPMATEFEKVGEVTSKRFMRLPFCEPIKVVKGALKAMKKGKLIYTNRLFYKFYRLLSKILPLSWLMKAASC